MANIVCKTVVGSDLETYVNDLARLRLNVFREYPYLYDGTLAYEKNYLRTYISCNEAMAVLALSDNEVIGASTGIPMTYETNEFKQPFIARGFDPQTVFYCGESILLPEYRGQGLYKTFFGGREDYAKSLGAYSHICFCAVVREESHPMRPKNYQPLDAVWRHFGYAPAPELMAKFSWQDVGQSSESAHDMLFWIKSLGLDQH